MVQYKLFETFNDSATIGRDVTFLDAKNQSVHRWYPYLEGFAEKFIADILQRLDYQPKHIYEPFAGSGTLPVYGLLRDISISYSEVNPFLNELILFKIAVLRLKSKEREKLRNTILGELNNIKNIFSGKQNDDLKNTYSEVFGTSIYFDDDNFVQITQLSNYLKSVKNTHLEQAMKIAACEALLPSSFLKRAGDIRYKKGRELNTITIFSERFSNNLHMIWEDLGKINVESTGDSYGFSNAKKYEEKLDNSVDLVITSPPYLNGTNYIRNTKLELWFLGYLKHKKDLNFYRKEVVTSGINDVGSIKKNITLERLNNLVLDNRLFYDKRIPKMINDYFHDMDLVFKNMNRYIKKGGYIFIDIGDSIYGGVHVQTDEILIELMENIGFKILDNLKLRERTSKCGDKVKQSLIIAKK
jgi:hypothetical protein